ncbi:MAG: type VI secretion system protein TssA [Acidobacteria bacterium]|nr:MAG: type VI secretion system protein TssA [Acidobacteriota bacterium]
MPLREDLLTPIPGSNPSGQNVRYAPVYDKIKEARRKEDRIAQGDWRRALKEADYKLVIKLATEALARSSKDLQIGAWLTEALAYEQGLSGLAEGLGLLRSLIENFWDTVYPEPEDGDLELRAAPLSWVGDYRELELAVRSIPLTKGGFSWLKYKESRTVGYEADVQESEAKQHARSEAITEGKLTAEEFDADVAATPLADLEQVVAGAESALEALTPLGELCEQKFGNEAPSFRILRIAIEDIQHTARMLAAAKRERELQTEPEQKIQEAELERRDAVGTPTVVSNGTAAAATKPARVKIASAQPADRDEAIQRIVDAAAFLRREDPRNPASYLSLRGLRWGELRAATEPQPELLEAPPTEIRQQLKRLMLDGQSEQVLELAESAMGLPCGRGWLDLQRYVVRACTELGDDYAPIATAIRSDLRALLRDMPQLASMTLLDDTATANAETQAWLAELTEPAAAESRERIQLLASTQEPDGTAPGQEGENADAYDVALESLRSGNAEHALQILSQQITQERSGRGRFLRRTQLAQICIFSNRPAIAYPILQDLAQEIELRKLENWEEPGAIAQTLVLLLQTMQKLRFGEEERQKVYAQICRLDPLQAARLAD